ncbi:MAG: T9SS type A sorting domain-containing protein [Bacteroidota bacterium]
MKRFCLLAVCALIIPNYLAAQRIPCSIYTYYYENEQDSFLCFKQDYKYDITGNLTSMARYSWWGSEGGGWEGAIFYPGNDVYLYGRFDYSYDPSGNLTETIGYSRDGSDWRKITREELEYDSDGNRVTWTFQHWNASLNDWTPVQGQEFTYNDRGQLIITDHFKWDTSRNNWHPFYREKFSYNDSGKKIEQLRFHWNEDLRDWTSLLYKSEWDYDSYGNQIWYAWYIWEYKNYRYQWVELERTEGITDAEGHLILELFNNQGVTGKVEYTYDEQGHLLSKFRYQGNPDPNWMFNERWEWVYNAQGQLVQETQIGPVLDLDLVEHLKIVRTFNPEGDKVCETYYHHIPGNLETFILWKKDFCYYRSPAAGTQDITVDPVSIYPNPTDGLMTFSGLTRPAEVKIFSIRGKLLRMYRVENTLDIHDLPAGTYILYVAEGNQAPVRNLIVKK